jgi:hypothetical protein
MRLAGTELDFDLAADSDVEASRFAGAIGVANPELVDRIKATIAGAVPEFGTLDESPE